MANDGFGPVLEKAGAGGFGTVVIRAQAFSDGTEKRWACKTGSAGGLPENLKREKEVSGLGRSCQWHLAWAQRLSQGSSDCSDFQPS